MSLLLHIALDDMIFSSKRSSFWHRVQQFENKKEEKLNTNNTLKKWYIKLHVYCIYNSLIRECKWMYVPSSVLKVSLLTHQHFTELCRLYMYNVRSLHINIPDDVVWSACSFAAFRKLWSPKSVSLRTKRLSMTQLEERSLPW